MTLTEFLLARIAEKEHIGRLVQRSSAGEGGPSTILAECEAVRRIVEACAQWAGGNWGDMEVGELYELADTTLATLGAVYADHPDYREEWKP